MLRNGPARAGGDGGKVAQGMKRAAVLVGIVLAVGAAGADFSAEWDRCTGTIASQYYAAKARKAELDALFREYRERAVGAASRSEFARLVNEMLGRLGDSHFELHTNDRQSYYIVEAILEGRPSPQPFIGAYFAQEKAGWRVEMVLNGSSAERAGLRKGDLVLKANGQPFDPVPSLRRAGGSAKLLVERDGKTLQLTAAVSQEDFASAALKASKASCRVIEAGGKKIGYMRLWMTLGEGFLAALADAATETFQGTDAMVLDLRDGFGGYYDRFVDVFYRPPVRIERKGLQSASDKVYGYAKPLAVLVNGGTRSAKETLAYMLKASGRAALVGLRTAGKLLGSSQFRIADWAILQVPVVDVRLDGKRFEGVGIEPDVKVEPEFGPNGEDLALQRAIGLLAGK